MKLILKYLNIQNLLLNIKKTLIYNNPRTLNKVDDFKEINSFNGNQSINCKID